MSAAAASPELVPCIVDNKPFATPSSFPLVDPQDRKTILHNVATLPATSVGDVVASSQRAFEAWRDTPLKERRKLLHKAAALFEERIPELIQIEASETTASAGFAAFDVGYLAADAINETPNSMAAALRGEVAPADASGKRMLVTREPLGCVLSIVPWNAPSTLCMRAIVNPLAAGNVVVLKTSEHSPKIHSAIARVFIDAGLPAGVLNVIHVSPQDAPAVTKALIEEDFVRKVNFTGSTRIGRIIARLCAENLKPVVLELGGKAPVIVTQEADIAVAANNVVFGSLINQGQVCMSTANVIVHKSVRAQFEAAVQAIFASQGALLTASAKRNSAGAPDAKDHRLRALFTTSSADRVKALYDDAISGGAQIVAGQPGFDLDLGVVQPVLLRGSEKMKIFHEEAFAPLVGLFEYETDDEAIRMANAPGAGLSSSIFCSDETKAWKLARRIESGAVHINAPSVHDDHFVPHGGFKTSGYGRFNGVDGVREFTLQKTVTFSPGTQMPFFIM